ncbi:hypothetical protein Godav_028038 [Gossypium davidsonii]|uniref:Uncharacterized protein n=1 Tax=Gossypium davidsonii TaxID=34287 RepID=A0A7J8RYX2_GOSDV|nr:hypothetical protein [Gossypium davidsonii]
MSTTMETEFAGLMINEEEEEILHNEKYNGKSMASCSGGTNSRTRREKVFILVFSYNGYGEGVKGVPVDF